MRQPTEQRPGQQPGPGALRGPAPQRTFPRRTVPGTVLLFAAIVMHLTCPQAAPCGGTAPFRIPDRSDFLERYDPGLPDSVSLNWVLPKGLALGFSAGHKLQRAAPADPSALAEPKTSLFPLSFLMRVPLFETPVLSQSMGFGIGPCLLHQGEMPIHLGDMEVTGLTTCLTEWVSEVSDNLFLRLRMKYTRNFESMRDRLPCNDFSTWLGMKVHW